jgi:hypothetical protein
MFTKKAKANEVTPELPPVAPAAAKDAAADYRREAEERAVKLERMRLEHAASEVGVTVEKLLAAGIPVEVPVDVTSKEDREHVKESIQLSNH